MTYFARMWLRAAPGRCDARRRPAAGFTIGPRERFPFRWQALSPPVPFVIGTATVS